MAGEDQARSLVQAMRAAARIRGHGTQTQALRACGLDTDYLYNVPPERVPLGTYLDLVLAAGLEPATQAERVLAAGDPVARFIEDGRRIRQTYAMPSLLDKARRQAAVKKRPADGGFDLTAIDDRRYEDVGEATALARRAVLAARGPEAVAGALGVWASCQRMSYRLDWASGALSLAVEIADTSCPNDTLLPVLRRASALLKDRGEFDFALGIARRVAAGYFAHGNLERFGQAAVDCAVVLIYSDLEAAGRLARLAVEALQGSCPRDLAAAYYIICRERAGRQDFDAATEAADRAGQWAARAGGRQLLGRVQWLRGIVAAERQDFRTAERHYYEALETLSSATYDALLIGAELVRVLLRAGRPQEAYAAAKSLAWFEDDLRSDPLDVDRRLAEALFDLVRAGNEAKLTLELLDQIIKRIEGGRRRRIVRLRRRLRA